MVTRLHFTSLLLMVLIVSCKQGPRESELLPQPKPMGHISLDGLSNDLHKVEIVEIIPASRYLYIKVRESNKLFWIATGLDKIDKGETYFYREALLKTNFKSKELQEVYDTLFLVTKLIPGSELPAVHATLK